MGTRKNFKIVSALSKKGLQPQMAKHIKLTFQYEGKDTGVRTWVSHGKKEIGNRLLEIMAEQLHLSRQEFDDLMNCPLGEQGLVKIYSEKGLL